MGLLNDGIAALAAAARAKNDELREKLNDDIVAPWRKRVDELEAKVAELEERLASAAKRKTARK